MDLTTLINNISNILLYILPGTIFLGILSYITNKKIKDNYYILSLCISYSLLTLVRFVIKNPSNFHEAGSVLLLAIILSLLLGVLCNQKWFNALNIKITNRSVTKSIWDEIKDEYNTFIKIYIPSDQVVYYGLFKGYEDKEENNYLLITEYDIKDYNGNLIKDYTEDRTCWATINSKDISRVEIFYVERSEKAKKIITTKYS